MKEVIWYEVWADEGQFPPYVLLLMHDDETSDFYIYDPLEKRIPFRAPEYDSAKCWMLEDEFVMVRGRMSTNIS
jgi:hypothetical protein